MDDILTVNSVPVTDTSITAIQNHLYNPYTTAFANNDEIRIAIQQQDIYVWPHDSALLIEGVFQRIQMVVGNNEAQPDIAAIINNAIAFLFDEIRYELNGFEIDRCKNLGITGTLKGYISRTVNNAYEYEGAGWAQSDAAARQFAALPQSFQYVMPLKMILGFAEDYRKIVMSAKHELILVRARNDVNSFQGPAVNVTAQIHRIQWKMPHIHVSDATRLTLLKTIGRRQFISMCFRSWDLYEYPTLQSKRPAN